jgi:type I restriction enzyme S subunit
MSGHVHRNTQVANVQDGFLDLSEIKEIDVPENQVARFTLKPGDLLLIEGNGNPENLGRGCLWEGQIPDCVHQNHVFAVRTFPEAELLPKFLALQLQSDHGRNYLLSCAKGSTGLSTLNSAQLKEFPLLVPPISEQRTIANAGVCWDAAIGKTEQLIAAKERHLNAIEHQLLTARKRLNGFSNNWESLRADKIFDSVSLKGFGSEPLLSVTQDRGVIPRDMLTGRVTMPSGETTSFKLVEPGNFVISLRSFQGGLEHSGYRGLVSPAYTVLRATREIDERFFRHYFRSADFIKRLSVAVIGIRDGKQVSFQDFCSIKIPFPPVEEQQAIATMLDEAEREIALLRDQVTAFKKQKRGLMQKLLTGQWRVEVPEEANP